MATSRYHYSIFTPYNSRYFSLNYVASTEIANSISIAYDVIDAGLYSCYSSYVSKKNYKKDFDLLPMAIRYVSEYNDFYIIERPPFQIEVDYSKSPSYRSRKTVKSLESSTMWIPWTVSVITFPFSNNYNDFSFEIYFNNKPLTSFDDKVINCWLPNTSSSRVCLGQDQLKVSQLLKNGSSITDVYNQMFNSFFAGWNSDLIPTFLETTFLSDFTSKLSSKKGAPKDISNSSNTWFSASKSKAIQNILYTFSNMQIEDVFQYIQSVKDFDDALEDDHYIKGRYSIPYSNLFGNKSFYNSIQSRINNNSYFLTSSSPKNNYYSYFKLNELLNSIISYSGSKDIYKYRFQIQINLNEQLSQDVNINNFIDNPYIIAQIFLKSQDISFNSIQDHSDNTLIYPQVVSMNFDISEVIQYNILRKENADVNAS